MGCGCGKSSYAPRRSSMVVSRSSHEPASRPPARTMNPPPAPSMTSRTPPHIVQSAALAARRTTLRRQV